MKYLILAFFMIMLFGCAYSSTTTKKTLATITSATTIAYHYTDGELVTFVGNATLTDLELTSVLEALDQIDRSKDILKNYKDDPEQLISNIQDIAYQYAKIKSAYLSVRSVVEDNWSEYTPAEQRAFYEFDGAAEELDRQFSDLVDAVEANTALTTALRLADTAIKIGAML
jgi:hypothetical protein